MSDRSNPLPVATSDEVTSSGDGRQSISVRRTYEAPRLVVLGSVRDLTLGGSGHSRDSGASRVKAP